PGHGWEPVRALAADPDEADRVAGGERDPRERGGEQRGIGELGAGRAVAAVRHGGRGVQAEPEGAIRLGLELADHEAIVAEQGAPIEEAEIVPGHVGSLPAELDAGALARA